MTRELATADLQACTAILARGSRSFRAASRLLPARLRGLAASLYAFCRVADDAVDIGPRNDQAVGTLLRRLDDIYAGQPQDDAVDRAFAVAVRACRIPRAIPAALIEGFAWDAAGRRYADLPALKEYCARVASTVGVMMALLFDVRSPDVMARAADLGLAMQLTNIARDVGEDARQGRIYLPLDWLAQAGIDPDQFIARPVFTPELGQVVARLLETADTYYRLADAGISHLPRSARMSIRTARLVYADIGRVITKNGFDSVSRRAFTSGGRKLVLLTRATPSLLWRPRPCGQPPAAATRALVEAACGGPRPLGFQTPETHR